MSKNTDSWKAFGSKYLKSENVTSKVDEYAITKVDSEDEDGKEILILTVERNGISKLFGCNATNEQAVRAICPESPKQVIGKVITFNKVKTTNPKTHKEVDGLRIQFVERPKAEPKEADTNEAGIKEDSTM